MISHHCFPCAQAVDTVMDTLLMCQQLNTQTAKLRWTEPLFPMLDALMDAAITFASNTFVSLISETNLLNLDKVG